MVAMAAERTLIARFAAQTRDMTKGIKQVNSDISSVATTTEKTNSKIGGVAKGMGKALVAASAVAATAVAAIGVSAVKTGIQTASAMEQARISFTTMLGSAQKADKFLKDLAKFAASTPFEFPELQTAASSLISAGIAADKVIPIMTTLGDVTSGMGTGSEGIKRATVALQQMNAAGKITGEDLNQLRDAGIPVYDLLSKALGKSKAEVVDLAQKGKLGGDALAKMMKALETGKGLERFNGLMKKQSASLAGIWSNLQDTFKMGMAQAVQPLLPMIKDGLGGAIKLINSLMPTLQSAFTSFAKVAGPAFSNVLPFIKDMAPALVGLSGAASPFGVVLKVIMGLMPELLKLFKSLLPVLVDAGKIIGGAVADAIKVLLPVLGEVVKVLGRFLIQALKTLMPILAKLVKSFVALLPSVLSIVTALLPLVPVVGDLVLALAPLLVIVADLVVEFAPLIKVVAQLVATLVTQLVPTLQALVPIIALVAKFLGGSMAIASKIVIGLVTQIVKAFTWMYNVLVGHSIIPDLVRAIVANFTWLWRQLGKIATAVRDAVVGKVQQLRDWSIAAFRQLRDSANAIMDTAKRWVISKMTGLRDGVRNLANDARDKALGAFRYLRDKVGGIFSSAVANIAKVWNGLKSVLKSPISFLIDTVINKGLIGAFNWVAKKVGAGTIGGLHISGFEDGGYTGRLPRKKVAGVVHGDEQVIRSKSRRKFEAKHPGWLDYLNRTGTLPGYASGGRVSLRGKTFTARFAGAIQNAQKLAHTIFSLFQGGFRPTTSYSGTSHAKDAVDLGAVNARNVRALRASGIAAWDRTGMGNWMPHIHGVPLPGFGTPGGSAVWQAQNYLHGGNGLGGRDNGAGSGYRPWPISGSQAGFFDLPSWLGKFKDVTSFLKDKISSAMKVNWQDNWWAQTISHVPNMIMVGASKGLGELGQQVKDGFKEKFSFDSGGMLPPGVSLAVNRTGHPEPIGWGAQAEPSQVITINVNGALDPDAVARQIQRLLANHDARRGGVVLPSRTRVSAA